MHYTEVASQLKAKHPEYANRDDKELVEKYVQRFPEKKSLINFEDYTTEQESKPLIPQDISKEDVGNYAKGVAQSVSQGLMVGQAPHVSGVLNETLNTPEKIYKGKAYHFGKCICNKKRSAGRQTLDMEINETVVRNRRSIKRKSVPT